MKKIFYSVVISASLQINLSAQNFWQPTNGPTIDGAGISSLVINSNDYIFAGTGDGIFRTTDAGDSWYRIITGLTALDIHCIAIDHNNLLFVGTDEGVFLSSNNGNNWVQKNNGLADFYVSSIAVNSSNHVFVSTVDGIFRTTNSGNNWIKTSNGLENVNVYSIKINSLNHIFAGAYEGIYVSTNNGGNWNQVNTGIDGLHVYSVGISKSDVIIVNYYQPYRWPQFGEGIRSSDNGVTWNIFNIDTSWFNIFDCAFDQDDKFFASTSKGLFKSEDFGANWTQINSNYFINPLEFDSNNILFAGSNGVFKSIDSGLSWIEKSEGLFHHAEIRYMAVNTDNQIFAGYMQTMFSSTNNGNNWIKCLDNNFEGYLNSLAINSSKYIFAGYSGLLGSGILKSTNTGNSWIDIRDTLFTSDIICVAINSSDKIFAGTFNGIYFSTDNGTTWLFQHIIAGHWISSIAFNSKSYIYATDVSDILMRSMDNGNTWTQLNTELGSTFITSLFIDLNDFIYIGTEDGDIYRSTNEGESWIKRTTAHHVHCFVANSKNYIFAATWGGGVFISTDNGGNWVQNNSGLAEWNVYSLVINSENYLFSGIKYGVYRSTSPTDENNLYSPSNYSLMQNYPNPFNSSTTITYEIPESGLILIKVYDILGREVATLVNEEKPSGSYKMQFTAKGMTSGIYFYQLKAGNYSETRKMILLR